MRDVLVIASAAWRSMLARQGGLRVELAGGAILVTQVGQAQAAGFGIEPGLQLLRQGIAAGQGVGHFAKGALDGFFLLGHGNVRAAVFWAAPRCRARLASTGSHGPFWAQVPH
jgi:hypothetical protein